MSSTFNAVANSPEVKKSGIAAIVVATAAGILTPGAYLLGYAYYEGYMNAFGVEIDGFPVSTSDLYIFSYQTIGYFLLGIGDAAAKSLNFLLSPPVVYFVVGTLSSFIGGLYWLMKVVRRGPHPLLRTFFERFKNIVSWFHWRNNDFTRSVGIVGLASYSLMLLASASIAIALFWWLLPLSAHTKGKEMANDRIKLFRDRGCYADEKSKWDSCFFVVDDKGSQLHEGLLIAVNDNVIAIFKKDGSYIFKRQDGYLLRRKLH